jgi:hypothetical protein
VISLLMQIGADVGLRAGIEGMWDLGQDQKAVQHCVMAGNQSAGGSTLTGKRAAHEAAPTIIGKLDAAEAAAALQVCRLLLSACSVQ